MDSQQWDRMEALFHEAADLAPGEQTRFIENACGDDQELRAAVTAMLEEDSRGASLLDRDAGDVAQSLLDAPAVTPPDFGPYRIRSVLGEGGMGVVYLADRRDLGSVVAIKILRDAWLSPARRERFATEQRMLAQLNHPSIARLYDADTLPDGTPWFAMEYVDGVPLTEYCRGRSVEETLRLFRDVCEAVQHAHLHAVIHRDLKPSNILVRADGGVRLLDFGIAKQLDATAHETRTFLRLMTPAYAAPEQVRGERVGIYTDVYALGVVLYELLAGRLPFDFSNCSAAEAETRIAQEEPEKPCGIADLDVLCLTAMHKAPERRYASVDALIRDIDHYLKGEPLEAQPDTWRYRMGKFVRRNRRAVTAAALVFVTGIALVAFFTVRLTRARNSAIAEATRAQRIQQFMLNLFQGGDEAAGPGDSLRVVTLLDRGVQQAQALNNEPAVQADLYHTLGGIYHKLGKFDRADVLLQSALDERRAVFGRDSLETAESLVALGLLRVDQERLPDADRLVREGLDMTRRHARAHASSLAKATLALGHVLEERGNYDVAVKVLEESVGLATGADLAASVTELASAQFYAGRYPIADSLFRRALDMHRKLYGDGHPLVAEDLISLGAVQFDLGYYAEAEKFDRQALEISSAYYGPEHPLTAHSLTVLGRALVYEKKFDEAAGLLEKALAIQERVYGPVSRQVASALNELGNTAFWRGELDEAEARFARMLEIYRTVYNNHHYLIGIALSNLAGVSVQKQNYARAEQLYGEALQAYAGTLPANHLNVGITNVKLGHALVSEKKYAEAEGHLLSGYEILTKQANPQVSYLRNARTDLVTAYAALNQPEKAERFRKELQIAK
jgi:tetratricopeptide (TPR) repeat protein/tRNA A-37 threonylcarbamoyl transferase component Bud32